MNVFHFHQEMKKSCLSSFNLRIMSFVSQETIVFLKNDQEKKKNQKNKKMSFRNTSCLSKHHNEYEEVFHSFCHLFATFIVVDDDQLLVFLVKKSQSFYQLCYVT